MEMKPKSLVHSYFNKTERGSNQLTYSCKYCDKKYTVINATKMTKHILKCIKCPSYCKTALQQQASQSAKVISNIPRIPRSSISDSDVSGSTLAVSTFTSAAAGPGPSTSYSTSTCSTKTAQSSIRSFVDQMEQQEQVSQIVV